MEQMRSEQQPQRRGKLPESQMTAGDNQQPTPPPPPPPPKKCPRCDSANTKFCYYNNYSLSQPRYFCKSCRRYWTHGGTLRNVPVGGGCRKSKRSKPPSAASTSSSAEIQRTQSLSSPVIQTQSLTGMIPGHALRSLPQPVIPSIGSFYTSGSFLSSLAAMQSFIQQPPIGINQATAAGPNLASTSQFGGGPTVGTGNTALLQGLNLPSLKAQSPQQFQAQNEIYRSQQILVPPTPVLSSWAQTVINNRDHANSSAVNPSFWGGATADNIASGGGGDQLVSSLNPNQWSDNHPGYNPSR